MPEADIVTLALTIALTYLYAFVGGFTDAANAIATAVATGAFTFRRAVVVAAVCEVVGALTGTAVALTIGSGIVSPDVLTPAAVPAALLGALTWSSATYVVGIPVSETHALFGAIVGVGMHASGIDAIQWSSSLPVLAAIVVSPVCGFGLAVILQKLFDRVRPRALDRTTVLRLQRLSCVYMALSHGRNDAQKPMGVLAMALAVYAGEGMVSVPVWVILSCAAAAGLGVGIGGWRIVETLSRRITDLTPEQGFSAETAAATALELASALSIPVSTTHTITSAIVGAGAARDRASVRWDVVREIMQSWALTLPVSAVLGYAFAALLQFLFT